MNRIATLALLLSIMGAAIADEAPNPDTAQASRKPSVPAEQIIPFSVALAAAKAALDACVAAHSPGTVIIVDLNDNPKVLLSADEATTTSMETARRKAYTVMKKGISSAEFGKRFNPPVPRDQVIEGDPDLVPYAGGLPIKRAGVIIGAIAVSSHPIGRLDETCAQTGLDLIH
jgi:uncharacterized protein GlcG (DUF336 family)